jgi:hypothetical protein
MLKEFSINERGVPEAEQLQKISPSNSGRFG